MQVNLKLPRMKLNAPRMRSLDVGSIISTSSSQAIKTKEDVIKEIRNNNYHKVTRIFDCYMKDEKTNESVITKDG